MPKKLNKIKQVRTIYIYAANLIEGNTFTVWENERARDVVIIKEVARTNSNVTFYTFTEGRSEEITLELKKKVALNIFEEYSNKELDTPLQNRTSNPQKYKGISIE